MPTQWTEVADREGLWKADLFNNLDCLTGTSGTIENKAVLTGLSNRDAPPEKQIAAPSAKGNGDEFEKTACKDTHNTSALAWTSLRQFINWQSIPVPGAKPRKVPVRNGQPIDPHDRANWMGYTEAIAAGLPVGFVLTDADPFFVIDIDGVKDATGAWDQRALDLLNLFPGSFVEVSVSGDGLHIWGRCDALALGPRRKKFDLNNGLKVEFYTSGRFMALGPSNNGGSMDLDWTGVVAGLVPVSLDPADVVPLTDAVDPLWSGPEDDDELVPLMLKSRGGIAAAFGDSATVSDLWNANVGVLSRCYPSVSGGDFDHSSADQALCNALAFWCGKSAVRMDRLFRRSGLYRQKWERADYRASTIAKAVRSCRNVYSRPMGLPPGVTAPRGRAYDDIMSEANNRDCQEFCAVGHDDEKERIITWLSRKNFWTSFWL
ncbi:hypothetical protein CN235_26495, partial [Sinorhizobium meliloti]